MNKNTLFKQIRDSVAREPKILAVYCFGSYSKNALGKESDFDLAFLLDKKNSLSLDQIYTLISHIRFPKDLDISIISKSSSPLFLYEIISRGERVYAADEQKTTLFEAHVLANYYDTSHMRKIYSSYLENKFPQTYASK